MPGHAVAQRGAGTDRSAACRLGSAPGLGAIMPGTDEDVRGAFVRRAGLTNLDVPAVVNAIKAIPHGRPRERTAAGVVQEWRGTCSTKILLLLEVCPDLPIRIFNRVFRLTRDAANHHLGSTVAAVVPPNGMIDVHTFAKVQVGSAWVTVDLTFPGEAWDGRSDMSIPWGDGDDFDAGDDPIGHKEALIQELGDPAARARFIEAISA